MMEDTFLLRSLSVTLLSALFDWKGRDIGNRYNGSHVCIEERE